MLLLGIQMKANSRRNVKTVAFFFGGRSAEHEISIISARSVLNNLDLSRFRPLAVFVDRKGVWKKADAHAFMSSGKLPGARAPALVPVPAKSSLLEFRPGEVMKRIKIDAAFSVIHGSGGEDGSIQGCFESLEVPYVGAGVLGSAVCADKLTAKHLLVGAGLPVVPFAGLGRDEWTVKAAERAARKAGVPCFVKPSNLGSSIGISRAASAKAAAEAAERSFEFSDTVIFERAVPGAREIEVSVLGVGTPEASVAGEIVPSGDFYDYQSKYGAAGSKLIVPASLPADLRKHLRKAAVRAFEVLRCEGMARVDFLVAPDAGEFFVSELNTIPGFTQISMYPMLWEASGVSYASLISRLIDMAFESARRRASLKTLYVPTCP